MKKITLTSAFLICFIAFGFGQWEQIDIPGDRYSVSGISTFKDKLITQTLSQSYISDKDSIHWKLLPLPDGLHLVSITPDSVIARGDAPAFPDLYVSKDLINWKHRDINLYKITNVINQYGEITLVSHKYFYKYPNGTLPRDTIIPYFKSLDGRFRFNDGDFNNRKSIRYGFPGLKDSTSTEYVTTQYVSTGDQFNWIDIEKDLDLVKTPDGKKYVIEHNGRLKERLRHDRFRYLWDDFLLADKFIRNRAEVVIIGREISRNKHFVAQYSPSGDWQTVFESDEEIPYQYLDENFLYGTDSSQFFYLNLNTSELTVLPFSDSIGSGSYIRRVADAFFLPTERGILKLDHDGVWQPNNLGLPKIAYLSDFAYDEVSKTLFSYQYNSNDPTFNFHYSTDEGNSWDHVSLPREIDLATNLKKFFLKGDSLLICAGDKAYNYSLSTGTLSSHNFRGGSGSTAFRKEDTIAFIIPKSKNCFISEDFGATWDTSKMTNIDSNLYGVHFLAKGNTLSFRQSNGTLFFYSPDFGRNWKQFQEKSLEGTWLVGIEKEEEIFYLKDSTYTRTWPYQTFMSIYNKKLNSKSETEQAIINFDRKNYNSAAYHSGTLYLTYNFENIFKKQGSILIRDPFLNKDFPLKDVHNFKLLGFSNKYAYIASSYIGIFRKKN